MGVDVEYVLSLDGVAAEEAVDADAAVVAAAAAAARFIFEGNSHPAKSIRTNRTHYSWANRRTSGGLNNRLRA